MKIEDIFTMKGISLMMILVAPLLIALSITMFLANLLVAFFILSVGGILIFLIGLIIDNVVRQKEKRKFKHNDWDRNCDGILDRAFDRGYYDVCSNCGYDSRGKEFCKKESKK